MTLPSTLVHELRGRRQRLGLSQRGLAARIIVDKTSLQRWERRKTEPRLDSFCAWAEELGFDIVLVPASGEQPPGFLGARR